MVFCWLFFSMQWKSWFLLISFIDAFDAFVLCHYFGSCFFCLVLPNFSLICESDWQSIQSKATFPVYHGLFMLSCSTFVTGNGLALASIYLQIRIKYLMILRKLSSYSNYAPWVWCCCHFSCYCWCCI